LTLTKNLDVPRIGPPLDADDTPRRDRLVVEYNTHKNPMEDGLVQDTSGRGNDGAFYGGASYDATEKALEFSGGSRLQGYHNFLETTNSNCHSFSVNLWFNHNISNPYYNVIFHTGNTPPVSGSSPQMFINGNDQISVSKAGYDINTSVVPERGGWYHVVWTYPGGDVFSASKIYVNGVLETVTTSGSNAVLNKITGRDFALGHQLNASAGTAFTGHISNFKLYDTALTAEEVKTLYQMGRCDEGHHTVNFSKTRVGIGLGDGEAAQAALDVRGRIMREYNPGEIIEELNTVCNGRPVTVLSGTYTPTNVTASQTSSVTHTEINGSFITYNKPVGAKRIYYKFACQWEDNGYGAITNFKIRVYHNGAWRDINLSRYTHAAQYHAGGAADHHGHDWVVMEFVFECDADTESQHDGRFLSSKTSYTFDATWRNHANAYSSILHKTHWWDGGSGIIHPPQLTIRAIA
jgi:hypothetical protein